MDDLLAHGTQKKAGKASPPTAAHHQKGGALPFPTQDVSGLTFKDSTLAEDGRLEFGDSRYRFAYHALRVVLIASEHVEASGQRSQ